MKKKNDLTEVIDELTEKWLGKKGVTAISEEEREGELLIIFFVNARDVLPGVFPSLAKGYKVEIRPSTEIITYSN